MPYCSECDKIFATRQSIWKHRQRKHVDQRKNILEKAKDSNGSREQTEQGDVELKQRKLVQFFQLKQ